MPTALAYLPKKRLTLFLLVLLIAILVVAALRLTGMPALRFSALRRAGFDTAALRADQDPGIVQRQFERFDSYYQGDAVDTAPRFARPS